MDIVILILNILSILFTVIMAFVLYGLMKGIYQSTKPFVDQMDKPYLLYRLSPPVVGILFILVFIAWIL